MERVECTFRATPCNEEHPQLFRAEYEVELRPDGTRIFRLIPGTLVQLTLLAVVTAEEQASETLAVQSATADAAR